LEVGGIWSTGILRHSLEEADTRKFAPSFSAVGGPNAIAGSVVDCKNIPAGSAEHPAKGRGSVGDENDCGAAGFGVGHQLHQVDGRYEELHVVFEEGKFPSWACGRKGMEVMMDKGSWSSG
jgi:hypothetical protein